MKKPINLFKKGLSANTINRMERWLRSNAKDFVNRNDFYDLKVGDFITFKNDGGVVFISKIIAFDKDNANFVYVFWDCYWFSFDLSKRMLEPKKEIIITDAILKLNEKANFVSSIQNKIIESIETLNKEKSLVFGHRTSCGRRRGHETLEVFRFWNLTLKEFQKQDIYLRSEPLVVPNSSPTLSGGFWKETRYYF